MTFNRILLIPILIFIGCGGPTDDSKQPIVADLILYNGTIYTVDQSNRTFDQVAVKEGRILALGEDVDQYLQGASKKLDLKGQYVYPGFIEGHAHIMGIGENILNVDLMSTKSYDEVINAVVERAKITPEGEWIVGRGWHQDKWVSSPEDMFNGFPTHHELSEAVPNHPVWLKHASGHASLANEHALRLAGVSGQTPDPVGGEIFKGMDNQPTGLLNEKASNLVFDIIPKNTPERNAQALELAMEECLKNGVTSFHQAGSVRDHVELFRAFASAGRLGVRLYVMLSGNKPKLLKEYFENGPFYDSAHYLSIRSVKLYSDGALGSRGAWLLNEYEDAPGIHGHNVVPLDTLIQTTEKAYLAGFQVCTHAIGDRANQEVLDMYENTWRKYDEKDSKRLRYRIEHAQHVDPVDIPRFAKLGVIPAMQAIHMSSDRPWAIYRLGKKRIEEGAYMWRTLIDSGAIIVNGSDAPVEPINPLASFYASISRKTLEGRPEGGYEPTQKMTRLEALRSYTINGAYGAFEEELKGSIELGKLADFTILNRDILTIPEDEILDTEVMMTIVGGNIAFQKSD